MTSESRKWMRFRIVTLLVFFLVLFIALTSRAFQLQILSGRTSRPSPKSSIHRPLRCSRNGILSLTTTAKSWPRPSWSIPSAPIHLKSTIPAGCRSSGRPRRADKTVLREEASGTKNFCWLARRITRKEANLVQELDIDGIFIVKEPKRYYPGGGAGRPLGRLRRSGCHRPGRARAALRPLSEGP